MSSRSSSAIVAPISATSFSRLNSSETPCSIFRCAIERNSARRASRLSAGRSRPSSWKTTMRPFPRAFAVIIATSAQATSSARVRCMLRAGRDPTETVTGPTRANSVSATLLAERSARRKASLRLLLGAMIAGLLSADPADAVARANGREEDRRHLGEHMVARRVAVHVVDALEVVEVEHHERDRRLVGRRIDEAWRSRSWKARWFQSPVSGSVCA